jgi:hypothetical protein
MVDGLVDNLPDVGKNISRRRINEVLEVTSRRHLCNVGLYMKEASVSV